MQEVADIRDPRLLMARHKKISIYYAPFDHLNKNAKVVILGITPGATQANSAILSIKTALDSGLSEIDALLLAKSSANFSGPMRKNLVSMLNYVGLHQRLGINCCSSLWEENHEVVQFSSALKYPVFVAGENYSGSSPKIRSSDLLMENLLKQTGEDLKRLPNCLILPLGKAASEACRLLINQNIVSEKRVAFGLPHPSGVNSERISYFLGSKASRELSTQTAAKTLDADRTRVIGAISRWRFQ